MTIFVLLLGGLTVWAIAATIIAVARDGYRRQPVRPQPEIWRSADARFSGTEPEASGPTDLTASQWLHAPAEAGTANLRPQHATGAMLMRRW